MDKLSKIVVALQLLGLLIAASIAVQGALFASPAELRVATASAPIAPTLVTGQEGEERPVENLENIVWNTEHAIQLTQVDYSVIGSEFNDAFSLRDYEFVVATPELSSVDPELEAAANGTPVLVASTTGLGLVLAPVPEPSTGLLAAMGLIGMAGSRRLRA